MTEETKAITDQIAAMNAKMEWIGEHLPELQQGLTQADIDGLFYRVNHDKLLAEKHMNTVLDRLIEASTERDRLASENVALRATLNAMIKAQEIKAANITDVGPGTETKEGAGGDQSKDNPGT